MVFYPTAVSGTDGDDDDDYDFEISFTSSFCADDQFEAAFHRSEHLFLRTCSVVEDAEGWGVSDWQAAASWKVVNCSCMSQCIGSWHTLPLLTLKHSHLCIRSSTLFSQVC